MAKKKKNQDEDNLNLDGENGEEGKEKGGLISGILLALAIILIWLVIFALLIKMDVGGVGTMLRPALKNVPVINKILPAASEAEAGYNFKNMGEAIERIKALEAELDQYKNGENDSSKTIADLQTEVARLKQYEENQEYYQKLKDQFDRDVVYTTNAPNIEEYKKWYESIDKDNAAALYKEVVERLQYSQQIKDWATTYATMEPAKAASVLEEMTGDTKIVAQILGAMTAKQRAAVMAEMDPVFAGKMTHLMFP